MLIYRNRLYFSGHKGTDDYSDRRYGLGDTRKEIEESGKDWYRVGWPSHIREERKEKINKLKYLVGNDVNLVVIKLLQSYSHEIVLQQVIVSL